MTVQAIPITDRESWLQLRMNDLTASDIASAAGFDDRRSPLAVYLEKVGQTPPQIDNNLLRRGRWLEPAVLAALREERPDWDIRRSTVYLRDPERRLGATPDAVAVDRANPDAIINVQLKVVARPIFETVWGDDGTVPINYQIQSLTEAMMEDAQQNFVAALVIDTYSAELVLREVPRHAGAEERIRQVVDEFWRRVANKLPPPPDYERDAGIINAIQATPGKTIDLSQDKLLPGLLDRREELRTEAKKVEGALSVVEAQIKQKMGDAEIATPPTGWRSLTWKETQRDGYTVKPTSFRTLRATREKDQSRRALSADQMRALTNSIREEIEETRNG